MRPTFSVIIPTYNRGYCVWKAIQSVQKQIYPYWELLVIDDGSKDATQQIVAEFQKDPRITYYKIAHGGGQRARNYGLEHAKGEIITYVDSDDFVYENFLSYTLEFFNKYPKKIFAISNYNRRLELYDKNSKLIDFTRPTSSLKDHIELQDMYHWDVKTCATGLFHRKIVIKDRIRWDPKIKRFQDWDFVLTLGKKYPEGFMHIPFALFEYLQKYGTDSMCSNASYKDWAQAFETMYKKHRDDPLMQGQQWYPQKVEKYEKRQKQFEKGLLPPAMYKNFPQYFKKYD